MSAANKKQRREAKRKAKRREIRRRESISPVKRLADAPGEVEVWMSEDFESLGQMQIFVYKRGAGLTGMAAFLVDCGVVGLKDAWIRMHIDHIEFDEMIQRSNERGTHMSRAAVEEVRRWIAGGLRWARDNGMRLPQDWTRAASFIGGVGEWQSADVSAFVKEFAGHPEDLRQRLIGEPMESYLHRDDIEFIFSTGAPYMDQRTGDYVDSAPVPDDVFDDLSDGESDGESDEESDEIDDDLADLIPDEQIDQLIEQFDTAAQALAAQTRTWLQAQGQAPSEELVEAWKSVMLASMVSKAAAPDADEDEVAELGFALLEGMSGRLEESRFAEYDRATGQVLLHLETDSMMMRQAVLEHPPKHLRSDEHEAVEQAERATESP